MTNFGDRCVEVDTLLLSGDDKRLCGLVETGDLGSRTGRGRVNANLHHERSPMTAALDDGRQLQQRVGLGHGALGQTEVAGQLPDGRQPSTGGQHTRHRHSGYLLTDLLVDGKGGRWVDVENHGAATTLPGPDPGPAART